MKKLFPLLLLSLTSLNCTQKNSPQNISTLHKSTFKTKKLNGGKIKKHFYSPIVKGDNGYLYSRCPSGNNDYLLWYVLLNNNNQPISSSNYASSNNSSNYSWRLASSTPTVVNRIGDSVELSKIGPTDSFKDNKAVELETKEGQAEELDIHSETSSITEQELQENYQEQGPEGWQSQQDTQAEETTSTIGQPVDSYPEEQPQEIQSTQSDIPSDTDTSSTDSSSSSDSGSSDSGGDSGGSD